MNKENFICLNMQMLRASHLVMKTYEDAYRPFGIRATQVPVLDLVAKEGPLSIKQIASKTITERSVLSRKMSAMEQNGWISKEVVTGTQERLYQITDQGREKLASIDEIRCQAQLQLTISLSNDEKTLLTNLCDKLILANHEELNP